MIWRWPWFKNWAHTGWSDPTLFDYCSAEIGDFSTRKWNRKFKNLQIN